MASLSRDQIFASRNRWPRATVPVPELSGELMIRVLTLKEAEGVLKFQRENPDGSLGLYSLLARESLCNDDGLPLCTADDAGAVESLPYPILERVALAALKLNGLTKDAAEDAAKN